MIAIKSNGTRDLNLLCQEHFRRISPFIIAHLSQHVIPNTLKNHLKLPGKLQEIICAYPARLIELEKEMKKVCRDGGINNANALLRKIFDYKSFANKRTTATYNAYHLAVNLNIKVCPYCNRQYTSTTITTEENISRPALDHFFDKGKHPMLSLSFYNLIPSCTICNSTLKNQKNFSMDHHLHPYQRGFDNGAKFDYYPHDYDSSIGNSTNLTINIEINETDTHHTHISENVKVFRLNEIYQDHTDIVQEVIRKFQLYNRSYLETLKDTFPQLGTKEELYQHIFSNYLNEDDYEKRVLSKLTKDIAAKLALVENINLLFSKKM